MSPLNWDRFLELPGAADHNFELVCHGAVRARHGAFGVLSALANQPGVEFHLRITRASTRLGEPGRWWGWQCRWWDIDSGRRLTTAQRRGVEEAIAMSGKHLPGLTDWVLWTRRPLSRQDAAWFDALKSPFQLQRWTEVDLDDLLGGEALILRETYFGELVMDGATLDRIREESLAHIKPRWHPELHQTTETERRIRGMLGEPDAWSTLGEQRSRLDTDLARLRTSAGRRPSVLAQVQPLIAAGEATVDALRSMIDAIVRYPLGVDMGVIPAPVSAFARIVRPLRSLRHPASIDATNVLADIEDATEASAQLRHALETRVIAVAGGAGEGKTHLAAKVTEPTADRPAGVLRLGARLGARDSLNALVADVSVRGTPVESMERLLGALDAAGQRVGRRIALAIDGLNESENPLEWQPLLAELGVILARYPRVLLVVTLRSAFIKQALPSDVERLELPGFGDDADAAVQRYFTYFKIDPTDSELPWEELLHPLWLYLFCTVTNPERRKTTPIGAGPGSLSALFSAYLDQAAERTARLSALPFRLHEADIRDALIKVGEMLWKQRTRTIERSAIRSRLGDDRPWTQSLVRALEDEGILTQYPSRLSGSTDVAVAHDRLAGHLIAHSRATHLGADGLKTWLKEPETIARLDPESPAAHPLAEDILVALAGITPRQFYQPFWPMVPEPLKTAALLVAARLEASAIDAETVRALAALITQSTPYADRLFRRLRWTRGLDAHPLNATFLNSTLRAMPVAERDLLWTEWVRRDGDRRIRDLERLAARWQEGTLRPGDRLRALWASWLLTSTDHSIRDHATRALYLFGVCDPKALFELAVGSLDIDDAYLPVRMLAAAYGVVMGKQVHDPAFAAPLRALTSGLRAGLDASQPRPHGSHRVVRLYVRGILRFARRFYPEAEAGSPLVFGSAPRITPLGEEDPRGAEADEVLGMDFENYTVGRLFPDRGNYQRDHPGHSAAVSYIRGTVWELGWRRERFGHVDGQLRSETRRRSTLERYGKKYSWAGLHNYAGVMEDRGERSSRYDERFSDVDIDPSFPVSPRPAPIALGPWVKETPASDEAWVRSGKVVVPRRLLRPVNLDGEHGPWVAVDGYFEQRRAGRRVFAILIGMLVQRSDRARLISRLERPGHPGNELVGDSPSSHYIFAGEIPWHPDFASLWDDPPYEVDLERFGSPQHLKVEILAHQYAWESYHSELNRAGGTPVPSRLFSDGLDLRGLAGRFDQVLPDGSLASRSFSAPKGFKGTLLYLREDLLIRYAGARDFIGLIWGERGIESTGLQNTWPEWLVRAARENADTWKHVFRVGEPARLTGKARARTTESRPSRRRRRGH